MSEKPSAKSPPVGHGSGELPSATPAQDDPTTGSLVSHLVELRNRLVRAVACIFVVFIPLAVFANDLFALLATPLISQLPEGTNMIATAVASPFLTPFKLAIFVAVFISMPYVLYQIWSFVAPGLYRKEKKFAVPLMASSTLLFYCGIAFAYFVVFPLMFAFFNKVAPEGVAVMTDIGQYLDFVITIFFAFGMAFEVPIATVLLVKTGLTTPEQLSTKRGYVFLGAFVLGMFLTPPDVISQTLLALPMYLLYEVGIMMSKLMRSQAAEAEAKAKAASV